MGGPAELSRGPAAAGVSIRRLRRRVTGLAASARGAVICPSVRRAGTALEARAHSAAMPVEVHTKMSVARVSSGRAMPDGTPSKKTTTIVAMDPSATPTPTTSSRSTRQIEVRVPRCAPSVAYKPSTSLCSHRMSSQKSPSAAPRAKGAGKRSHEAGVGEASGRHGYQYAATHDVPQHLEVGNRRHSPRHCRQRLTVCVGRGAVGRGAGASGRNTAYPDSRSDVVAARDDETRRRRINRQEVGDAAGCSDDGHRCVGNRRQRERRRPARERRGPRYTGHPVEPVAT